MEGDGKKGSVSPGFFTIYRVNRYTIGCPFGASLLYAVRENVSLVNGRSTRHVARAIGSEKHLWKRASPFTSEATDYLIPSGRAQGEKMTVCEWPRSLPPALSLSLSLPLASEKRRSMISSLFRPRNNEKAYSKFPIPNSFAHFSKSVHGKGGTFLFFFFFFFILLMVGETLRFIPSMIAIILVSSSDINPIWMENPFLQKLNPKITYLSKSISARFSAASIHKNIAIPFSKSNHE